VAGGVGDLGFAALGQGLVGTGVVVNLGLEFEEGEDAVVVEAGGGVVGGRVLFEGLEVLESG
jgi:hypothetical protein